MVFILFLAFVVLVVLFPVIRCAVCHPILLVGYGVRDLIRYFRNREYNLCGCGELVGYIGLFGRGKTLSVVHRVVSAYKRFDGKKVWCARRGKIVTQKIKIISNVNLRIPYIKLDSLAQIVEAARAQQEVDDAEDTLTSILVLGDEFSVQMNSRNFRTNIDPLFLNTILTCRHYRVSLYYTAQRFGHVDALLRQVTSYVVECDKFWRFQRLSKFSAWDLENATSSKLVSPYARSCWFVRDSDYQEYDTLAVVDNLKHEIDEGKMMTPQEILELQRSQGANMEAVNRPSKGWLRRFRSNGKRKA